jgi:hypothetical protein
VVARPIPRVQEVVLPLLRAGLTGVTIGSWGPDVDKRTYPYINIRRLGGVAVDVALLDRCVIEMTVYSRDGIVATENLYLDARKVLWDAVENQTVVSGKGYLHSFFETLGPTQFDSPFDDSWRVQGLIQLGIRPPNHS